MGDEDGWVDGNGMVWMSTAWTVRICRATCVLVLVLGPNRFKSFTVTKINDGVHNNDDEEVGAATGKCKRERDQRTTTLKRKE